MKSLFIATMRQNDGKSTLSLGLLLALRKKMLKAGFMKPVGQPEIEDSFEIAGMVLTGAYSP